MERINWADPSMSGGLFEEIVGCLLGNEHPESVRVRPAQGDGGVDIFIPVGDGVIDVYQAKHYPNRLHWQKIRESMKPLRGGTWLGRTIRAWYLTVPQQPTPANLATLEDMGQGVPFDVRWFGRDRLNALAARYPEVGDYYLGDGRAQLKRKIQDWDACVSRMADDASPRIEDAQARLTEIAAALGRNDPHLTYGVGVQPAAFDPGLLDQPGAVVASSCNVAGHIVSCFAYPKYRGADQDAADRLQFRLNLTPDAAARLGEAIAVGGDPVELTPADILAYEPPAVGHQPPVDAAFYARLTPHRRATPAVLRLVLTTSAGERTVSRITRRSFSPGQEGATSVWTSPAGCFELTTVARSNGQLRLGMRRVCELEGPIAEVADDINLMRALQPDTAIGIALDRGPVDGTPTAVTLADSLVDPQIVDMLDALRVIQDHTATVVTIPATITSRGIIDLVDLAALLEGIAVTDDMRRQRISATLPKAALAPDGPQDVFGEQFTLGLVMSAGTELELPHQRIQLPHELLFVRVLRSARIATVDEVDNEHVNVSLEPGSIPIWIDQRIHDPAEFTESLHHALCAHNRRIATADLSTELAVRGMSASR